MKSGASVTRFQLYGLVRSWLTSGVRTSLYEMAPRLPMAALREISVTGRICNRGQSTKAASAQPGAVPQGVPWRR